MARSDSVERVSDTSSQFLCFVEESGESGREIASRDWSKTVLGPIDDWPEAVKTTLGIVLTSTVPMAIIVGPDGIILYNDGYAAIAAERHPALLGMPLLEGWPEAAEFNAGVLTASRAGHAISFRKAEVPILRDGMLSRAWFDLDYSPVIDCDGMPVAMLAIVIDATEPVLAARREAALKAFNDEVRSLEDPADIADVGVEAIGRMLEADSAGFAELVSEHGERRLVTRQSWVANPGGDAALLSPSGDPTSDELIVDEGGEGGASLSVPLFRQGALSARIYARSDTARRWTRDEIDFVRDVADRTWAAIDRAREREAVRQSEERMRMALVAGGFTDWYWDAATDRIRFSEHASRDLDIPENYQPTSQDIAAMVPDDHRQRVIDAGQKALDTGETYEIEYPMHRPDGSRVWIATYGKPLLDHAGRVAGVMGISKEITDRKRAEEAIQNNEASLRLAIEGAGMATWDLDLDTMKGHWSANRFEILGLPRKEGGSGNVEDWLERIHATDRPIVRQATDDCFSNGIPFTLEYRIRRADTGEERWLQSHGNRITPEGSGALRFVGVSFDITERKHAERRQQLLINELNHRVKNTLAIIQSIAHQSFKNLKDPTEARTAFESRLTALSTAHNLLTEQSWEWTSMRAVIDNSVAVHAGADRVRIEGPDIPVSPKTAVSLAMAIHELATNAIKYGALSSAGGVVDIRWSTDEDRFHLEWSEHGGPAVTEPVRRGFGSRMIERGLAAELGGEVRIDFAAAGILCTVDAPLPPGPLS